MTNSHSDSDKTKIHENNNSDFSISNSKPPSRSVDLSKTKPFKVYPIDFSESAGNPPYYTYEKWNNICKCDCHKNTLEEGEENVKDIGVHINKIDKIINDQVKGEPYCQSGQEECKMPTDCKWHKSSFARDYYRYRQDSIPKPKLSSPPTDTALYGKKITSRSFPKQTTCCLLQQPRIQRKLLPPAPSDVLKEVFQMDDEESLNIRPKQKSFIEHTAYGIKWKLQKLDSQNDADSKKYLQTSDQENLENLLNMKLSLLDKYLQLQFEQHQNYPQQSSTSPDEIYEMIMNQISEHSVTQRNAKVEERTPSFSPPLHVLEETRPDTVGDASDTDDNVFVKAEFLSEHHVSYRNLPFKKRTTSTSSESTSSIETTTYLSSGSNEQTSSLITSSKKYVDLRNSTMNVVYENPFSHRGLFELAQKDNSMNQIENPFPREIKTEPVEIDEHMNDTVTVDENKTIVVTSDDGTVKVMAPYQSKMARNYKVVQRTERQEWERQRNNLASRISRAKEDIEEQCKVIPSVNGRDTHHKKKKKKKKKQKHNKHKKHICIHKY